MYVGCQSVDFGVQLLLRLVHLLTEPGKGRSHLPGNTKGTTEVRGQILREGLPCVSEGGRGLTVGPDGCSWRW